MDWGKRAWLMVDPSDPKLIKIEGTMELCEELDIDPESVCRMSTSFVLMRGTTSLGKSES